MNVISICRKCMGEIKNIELEESSLFSGEEYREWLERQHRNNLFTNRAIIDGDLVINEVTCDKCITQRI